MYKIQIYRGLATGWQDADHLGTFESWNDANYTGAILTAKSQIAGWSNDRDYRIVEI